MSEKLEKYNFIVVKYPQPDTAEAALAERAEVEPRSTDLAEYGRQLQGEALLDGSAAFIVHAHAVKTSRAAAIEAAAAERLTRRLQTKVEIRRKGAGGAVEHVRLAGVGLRHLKSSPSAVFD